MKEVGYREIRTGQFVVVKQLVEQAPGMDRLGSVHWWAGKVTETNAKWLKAKNGGKEFIIAQQGKEHFYVLDPKEFKQFIKDFNLEDAK